MLRCGDRNTKFFHNYALVKRGKNFIIDIFNSSGDWIDGTDQLFFSFNFFSNLFESQGMEIGQGVFYGIQN